jgi:twinkle protein
MSKIIKTKLPCLSKECGSSDARRLYDTLTSFCFSCQTWFPPQKDSEELEIDIIKPKSTNFFKKQLTVDEVKDLPIRGFKERGITKTVAEYFDVKASYGENGEIDAHYYPYDDGAAYKVRKLPKEFTWINKSTNLFGQSKFSPAGKRLIITEGEIDALSIAQASLDKYKKIYPVVAMSSANMTKSLLENRDWIRTFHEVVLCLDNDEAGKKATEEAIRIIGIDKAKIAKLPCKDPNEVLLKFDGMRLLQCVFEAAPYIPAGIIGKEELWQALQNYNSSVSVPYPECLEGVNTKLKGMRAGEITLFISGTGSGKSTVLREIMLHILENTEDKIGVVSLEESPAETARKLAGMVLNRNPAKEEIPLNELQEGFDKVFGSDRVVLLDHQGSINDNSIVDQLEYMCLTGCKYLFIDHITILVSEGVENLTGNEAQDKVMNDLLRLVKRHPVWIGLVSHLRKAPNNKGSFEEGRLPSIDDIRGSGSIKQISFDIISFARNLTADNDKERNTIKMRILKSRYTGLTGSVKGAHYIYDTGRLLASTMDIDEEFVSL